MVVIDQPTVDLLEQHFLEDLERSRRIELTRWEDRRLRQRLLERAVRPIRRWL